MSEKRKGVALRPVVDGELDADAAWLRASVEAFDPRLRELEARERRDAGGGAWETRPDLGCGLTCRCCPRRLPRRFLDLDRLEPGNVARRAAGGRPLALGAGADPWAGDTARRTRTRAILDACRPLRGADLFLTTASPLVICDLDLLTALDRTSSLALEMVLPTADPGLAARLEPAAGTPAERLGAVAEIAAEGIATHLRVAPMLPSLTDSAAALRPLLATAAEIGVADVAASPLRLPWRGRRRFFRWLRREAPELVGHYRRLYRPWRRSLPAAERQTVLRDFERLRLELGFPRGVPGRG